MQVEQKPKLIVKKIKKVSGLYYIPNLITNSVLLLKSLDAMQWIPVSNSNSSRKVQHYGYLYDYITKKINIPTNQFPQFLKNMAEEIEDICLKLQITSPNYKFNQCIVNNYECGQGIRTHTDVKDYGDVICCYTINSGATMKFVNPNTNEKYTKYVEPNSLYIMSGDARRIWTHEMPNCNYDLVDGEKIQRGRRISITFRNVPNNFIK
jgi:alkylated DNA repair dioxygenase AlkB